MLIDKYVEKRDNMPLSGKWYGWVSEELEKRVVIIEADIALSFRGDFHGVLRYLEVDTKIWDLVTWLNGLSSTSEYSGNREITLPLYPNRFDFSKFYK